jgi:hypothetical protein
MSSTNRAEGFAKGITNKYIMSLWIRMHMRSILPRCMLNVGNTESSIEAKELESGK